MVGASLIFSLLISALALAHCLQDNQAIPLHHLQWGHRNPINSHTSSSHTSNRKNSGGSTVLEILKHDQIKDDDHQKLLLSDASRVSSIQSHIKIPLVSGIQLRTLNYVVDIGVGGRKRTVIVDTGSDLTWIQCKPCVSCYNQQDPLFDPSSSASYHPIPCASPTCTTFRAATGAPGSCGPDISQSCYYGLSYGDGSYTRGILATETLTLGGTGTAVQDFIFGCGFSNHGLFGGTSGIMGLGRSNLSLISQTSSLFNGVFSYCLPSHVFNSSGSLVLGDDPSLYKNTTPVSYTRMISDPIRAPFYFLNLTGVTVGGVVVHASGLGTNMLIDSGTVVTRLAPSIYKAVKAEFVKQLADYPTAPSFSILDTCFDLSKYEKVRVPLLKLGFDGGVWVDVDVSGIFYFVKRDASQVCMAVMSLSDEDEVGIIGNYQQRNLRVVYDTVGGRLGFAEEACGF